jgi:bifunctional DNA-binding transcriptional regulator/antitoxin component of YhaV-PrlF toxin-antitoxin module
MDDRQAIWAKIVRVFHDGQVALPAEFRQVLKIEENSMLSMVLTGDGALLVRPLRVPTGDSKELPRQQELDEVFAPLRQRLLAQGLDSDEVNALIDRAIQQTRASRNQGTGSPWLKELYELFADARQEAIEKGYTDDHSMNGSMRLWKPRVAIERPRIPATVQQRMVFRQSENQPNRFGDHESRARRRAQRSRCLLRGGIRYRGVRARASRSV